MQLTVTGKQIDVGDALRQHVADSLESILEKYFGQAIDASVVFSREAHLLSVQVTIHIGRGIMLASEAKAEQPYPAFDEAAVRLSTRLRRYKTRLRDHHRAEIKAERASQYVVAPGSDEAAAGDAEAVPGDGGPLIVAEMATDVPTLTVSEAVMRLDLASQSAMMFRNRAHGGLNMVYRRADGNFGWVDPGQPVRN
ncbi:ribosome hibernation-promoting factor, HPF/YfiA family [Hypericibacter sp.]|uniref:ribosome hibernation-promoting factor, HPF/YfiA family n=1 Tax=Hypericibacter sp. TaxID=2705401 RepID=UPI003D6D43E1